MLVPFNFLVASAAIILSVTAVQVANSYSGYHLLGKRIDFLNIATLAASTHIAKDSNNYLKDISKSLEDSIETRNTQAKEYRLNLTLDFIENIARSTQKSSPLRETFELGLRGGRKEVLRRVFDDNYQISLINSDYLTPKQVDSISDLASTLLGNDHKSIKDIDLNSFGSNFIQGDSLLISRNLLEVLVNNKTDVLQEIETNPDLYGITVSEEGLDWDDLATGVRVSVKTRKKKAEDSKQKIIRKTGTAQLRVQKSEIDILPSIPAPPIEEPPPVINPPIIDPPIEEEVIPGPIIIDPVFPVDELEIEIRQIDYRGHKFFYDENRPISQSNPLGRVNQSKGVSYIYQGEDKHLNLSVGQFTNAAFRGIDFRDSAEMGIIGNFAGNQYGDLQKLAYDSIPRFAARYGKTTSNSVINGIQIPANSIVVGIGAQRARPSKQEFTQIRIYDSSTGALITQLNPRNQNRSQLRAVNFPYTPIGTTNDDGAKIFQHISTSYLFSGEVARSAVEKFVKIQADLATRTQSNINSRTTDWHKKVHSGYRRTGDAYTDAILDVLDGLEPRIIEQELKLGRDLTISEERNTIKDYLQEIKAHIDDIALDLETIQVQAMRNLAAKREEIWGKEAKLREGGLNREERRVLIGLIGKLKLERTPLKAAYDKARRDYGAYIRNRIVPPGMRDTFTDISINSRNDNISVEAVEPVNRAPTKKKKNKKRRKKR